MLFDNLSNILFSKQFLACNDCFGLFAKIKKESQTGFWCLNFQNYLGVIIWQKNEKEQTQALGSSLIKILCNRMICKATMSS